MVVQVGKKLTGARTFSLHVKKQRGMTMGTNKARCHDARNARA